MTPSHQVMLTLTLQDWSDRVPAHRSLKTVLLTLLRPPHTQEQSLSGLSSLQTCKRKNSGK